MSKPIADPVILRLSIAARDVARVAELAQVGVATVRRYRATWDGQPRYHLRRAQEAAITRAVGELPPMAQLDLPVVAPVDNPPATARHDAALIMGDDILPPSRHLDEGASRAVFAGRVSAPAPKTSQRCRVTVLMPDGSVAQP